MQENLSPPPSDGRTCPNCGARTTVGAEFCRSCGFRLHNISTCRYVAALLLLIGFAAIGALFLLLANCMITLNSKPNPSDVRTLESIGIVLGAILVLLFTWVMAERKRLNRNRNK